MSDDSVWDEIPEPPIHYDYDGEPITLRQWTEMFESPERLLKQEWILCRDGVRYWVSTVWLGIDHNHLRWLRHYPPPDWYADEFAEYDTRPWVFETMAFANRPAWNSVFAQTGEDVEQTRDATREEALRSHERVKSALVHGES